MTFSSSIATFRTFVSCLPDHPVATVIHLCMFVGHIQVCTCCTVPITNTLSRHSKECAQVSAFRCSIRKSCFGFVLHLDAHRWEFATVPKLNTQDRDLLSFSSWCTYSFSSAIHMTVISVSFHYVSCLHLYVLTLYTYLSWPFIAISSVHNLLVFCSGSHR